jgi:hypothetical protein
MSFLCTERSWRGAANRDRGQAQEGMRDPPRRAVQLQPDLPGERLERARGGTFTLTVTEQGQMVTNADGTFHEFLKVTFDLREDWTDGSYLIDQAVGPVDFNMNATGTTTFSGAQQDRGTLYSSTGHQQPLLTSNRWRWPRKRRGRLLETRWKRPGETRRKTQALPNLPKPA